MQWFVVKYRKPDGTMAEAEFEAADKSALFKLLAEKKISAISVSSRARMGERSDRTRSSVGILNATKTWLFALLALFVVVCAGILLLDRDKRQRPRGGSPIHKTKDYGTKMDSSRIHERTEISVPAAVKQKSKEEELMEGKDPEKWMVIAGADGAPKLIRVTHPGWINGNPPPKPIFRHPSENELASVVFGDLGERVVGITVDALFRQDLAVALTERIEVDDSDTEEVRTKKMELEQIKDVLRDALKNGEDPCDLVVEAITERNRVAAFRENLLQDISDARKDGLPEEEIDLMREAANKMLEQRGGKLIRSRAELKAEMKRKFQEKANE